MKILKNSRFMLTSYQNQSRKMSGRLGKKFLDFLGHLQFVCFQPSFSNFNGKNHTPFLESFPKGWKFFENFLGKLIRTINCSKRFRTCLAPSLPSGDTNFTKFIGSRAKISIKLQFSTLLPLKNTVLIKLAFLRALRGVLFL